MTTQTHAFFAAMFALSAIAGQAAADPMQIAFDHFNDSADKVADVQSYPGPAGSRGTVSTMGVSPVWRALDHLNADADSPGDVRGTEGVTFIGGRPLYGADIHERIRLEGSGRD